MLNEWFTCTMATWRSVPRRPTIIEAAAITAGPVRNLTAIAKAATVFPHAIILGWSAMNKPIINPYQNPQCHNPLSTFLQVVSELEFKRYGFLVGRVNYEIFLTLFVHLYRVGAKHRILRHSRDHCWIRHYALTIYQ